MKLENLLRFVLSHNHRAWISNGQIMAVCVYTKDGQAFEKTELVGNTLTQCRDWLGY